MAKIQLKLVLADRGTKNSKGYLIQAQLDPEVPTMYLHSVHSGPFSISMFRLVSFSKISLYMTAKWLLTCQAYIINTA